MEGNNQPAQDEIQPAGDEANNQPAPDETGTTSLLM